MSWVRVVGGGGVLRGGEGGGWHFSLCVCLRLALGGEVGLHCCAVVVVGGEELGELAWRRGFGPRFDDDASGA